MRALDLPSLTLAVLIGYAVHRASLCNVRAVAELIESGSARMRASFAKAVRWSATVAGTLVLVVHLSPAPQLLSAIQRRSFALRSPRVSQVWRHAPAGWLMGVGAGMLPGGNDTLLISAIPTLSMQAAAAYIALLAGIAITLWAMRQTRAVSGTSR
jgi:hypothetical protein